MLNDGETVQCQISDAAMDELAGKKGTENTARQRQFLSLRDTIERIASDLFDEAPTIQGYVIRISCRTSVADRSWPLRHCLPRVGLVQLLVWPTVFGATLVVLTQLWRIDRLGLLYEQRKDSSATLSQPSKGDVQMKRLVLIGFAACAFAAMPSFSVLAMPMAPAAQLIAETDSSVILAKGGHGTAGAEHLAGPFGWS